MAAVSSSPPLNLVTALGIDRATLSRNMSELGCRPTRERIPAEDGTLRQVRGYLIADIRTAAEAICKGIYSIPTAIDHCSTPSHNPVTTRHNRRHTLTVPVTAPQPVYQYKRSM